MNRPAFALALAFCLAVAGCQSDVPEERYDVDHPFDRVMVVHEPSSPIAARARANLEAHVAPGDSPAELARRFAAMRIACSESGPMMRCVYARNHNVTGKGLVTRLRRTFIADIDLRRRPAKVWRVCIESAVVDAPTAGGRVPYAPICDTAK